MSPEIRLFLFSFLGGVLGGAIGWIAERGLPRASGQFFGALLNTVPSPWVGVGILIGVCLGLVLGLYALQQRRRWLAVALVILMLTLSFVLGGVVQVLIALCGIVTTMYVSSSILRDFYGGSSWEAFRHHITVWLNLRGGIVVVDQGKIVIPSGAGPFLGPMQTIVRPGNAVVMVSGSTITRICGPSVFMSNSFEYVSRVISLERNTQSTTIREVLSITQTPFLVSLTYTYGINIFLETVRGEAGQQTLSNGARGLFEQDYGTLQTLVTLNLNWESQTQRIIQGAVRDLFAGRQDFNLLVQDNYQLLAQQIEALARQPLQAIGCILHTLTVVQVALDPALMQVQMERNRIITLQLAEGQGYRQSLGQVAVGYGQAKGAGMTDEEIRLEAQRHMMEHMAKDPATKVVMAGANPLPVEEV